MISQLRIGMDLTRFALPVYILEKRSLLEMYAEFFAHPDILTRYIHVVIKLMCGHLMHNILHNDYFFLELLTSVTPRREWLRW